MELGARGLTDGKEDDHEGQHDRVAPVEGVLFDTVVEEGKRYEEPQVENEHRVELTCHVISHYARTFWRW